jgi:prevent-host-death family protein
MKITATEFKAKSLALIDQVNESGEPIFITKRGRVVARLVADGNAEAKPWLRLRGTARWMEDPLKPAISESEVESLK